MVNQTYVSKLLAMPLRGASLRFNYGEWIKVRAAIRYIQRIYGHGYVARCHPITRNMIVWRLK